MLTRRFRIRAAQKRFFGLIVLSIVICCLILVLLGDDKWLLQVGVALGTGQSSVTGNKVHKNYFLYASRLNGMGLVVNNSRCQIVDFSPWDQDVIPLIQEAKPLENCKETNYNWSYMDNSDLVINTEEMLQDGYVFTPRSCCYKTIRRDAGVDSKENKDADNLVSYSDCNPIVSRRTPITTQFIMVECSWLFVGVAYRGFHGIAIAEKDDTRDPQITKIKNKIRFWKNKKDDEIPPSILVVGIDSTSRINFRRNMFKTKLVLEKLGATEMFGYTKVGENTFPNYCAMFNGYSEEDLQPICYATKLTYQDDCPLIWKQLDQANYLTAHTEDSPEFTGFNYRKAGFKNQPVDFYARPLFLAAHDYGHPLSLNLIRSEHLDCISYQTNDESITTYMESTMDFAFTNQVPIFSFSWSTTLAHDNLNMIQLADATYANFLQRLIDKGHMNNTILLFMGDHGYRFGAIRETLIGYYEDKLPNLWISLPPRIQQLYPQWQEALQINSRRLTSPFTYYWTLNHILETFATISPLDYRDPKSETVTPRRYRQHFLHPVPESNSCAGVGVPETYCACYPLEAVPLNDTFLLEGAIKATNKINKDLTQQCASLTVSKITAGAVMDKSSSMNLKRYIIGFITVPGEFLIEAEIDYFIQNGTFSDTPNVQRASKINQDHVKCIKDLNLELFCYCN